MARFQYRLQKVYELRERKKKEQEKRVAEAQARLREIEQKIEEKKNEIRLVRQNMLTAPHTLMQSHDDYIHHLNEQLDDLYAQLKLAQEDLAYQRELLKKAHAELEALIKHKEKVYEEWQEEEKKLEMKQLNEVATQRYFRAKKDEAEDEIKRQAAKAASDETDFF